MKNLTAVILCAVAISAPMSSQAATSSTSAAHTLMSKLNWRSIGPYIGGRVVAVAGVASDPDLFYMGGVQGGIWRSTNYGLSWENISDGKIPGIADSIGALAVAPSNPKIIYAGTGESDIRGDFDTGDGIYKTTDAGKTWHYAGLRETHMTSSLVIDPRNPNVVFATSMGHVFAPNPDRGVFKTTDGGKTWTKILYVDDKTGANDVVMDPHHPDTLYASMWQAQRTPWDLDSGGPGSGIYKTTDGGATWTKISTNPGFATGVLGKMGLAVAASDPNVVYAMVQATDGGVFRSNDGGATWHRVNSEWKLRQRAFYYMAIYVDPKNPNTVFVPNVDSVWKSTNAGKTWQPLILTSHGDNHIIWINPNNTNILLEGDDGGAIVSVDGGKTWSSEYNQPTGQFYHIALDSQFPYHVYGAQQDEGAYEGPSASNEGLTLGAWHTVALGESTYVAVDPRDPNITYGSGYYSAFARLDTSTGEFKNVSPWPRYMAGASSAETKYRFGWTHPVMFSPVKPDELFETAQVVFKSDDFGQTWTIVSPDLTRNDKSSEGPSGGPVYLDQTGAETFPDIASFNISPLSADVMWAGSADGLVHVTTDGGANWKDVTPPALPQWAQISSIEPSHTDKGTAFVTASRFMFDDFHPYIYKTTDYGAAWTAMTNGIPQDQYVFVVRQDPREPRLMVAGTRSTVYVSLDGGSQWQPLSLDLPGVQVRDLAFNARQGELAAATHGRSFWILDDIALLEQLARASSASTANAELFAPETAWLTHAYGSGPFPVPDSGDNPAYGATIYFNIPHGYDGKNPVKLTFLDSSGKTVRSFDLHLRDKKPKELRPDQVADLDQPAQTAYALHTLTAIGPGMNKFQWDLRYTSPTEVTGLHNATSDDFSSGVIGATIVPGTYTAVLDYAGKTMRQTFQVVLDPRLHPGAGDLQARLAFATSIGDYLDSLDRTVNAALAARAHMPAAQRAQVDSALDDLVQFDIRSDEGDLLHENKLHEQLAFLMNSLDNAYQAPTKAEYAAFDDLKSLSDADLAKLQAAMKPQ